MKKLILAVVIAFSTIAFSACTKDNVQPNSTHKPAPLSDDGDKGNLGQGDGGVTRPK